MSLSSSPRSTPGTETSGLETTIVIATVIVTQAGSRVISSGTRTTSSSPTGSSSTNNASSSPAVLVGAIIGSAVGGSIALIVLFIIVFKLVQHYRAKDKGTPPHGTFDPTRFTSPHSHIPSEKLPGASGIDVQGVTAQANMNQIGQARVSAGGIGVQQSVPIPYLHGGLNSSPSNAFGLPDAASQMSLMQLPYSSQMYNTMPGANASQWSSSTQMSTMQSIPGGDYLSTTSPITPPQQQQQQRYHHHHHHHPNLPNPFGGLASTSAHPALAFNTRQPQRHATYRTSTTITSTDSGYLPSSSGRAASPTQYAATSTSGCSSNFSGELEETAVREKQREAIAQYASQSAGGVRAVNPGPSSGSGLIVHEDGGRVEVLEERREEIPPAYDSIKQDR